MAMKEADRDQVGLASGRLYSWDRAETREEGFRLVVSVLLR